MPCCCRSVSGSLPSQVRVRRMSRPSLRGGWPRWPIRAGRKRHSRPSLQQLEERKGGEEMRGARRWLEEV